MSHTLYKIVQSKRSARFIFVLSVILGAICFRAQAADTTINISSFSFTPQNVTINVGDTITWNNLDSTPHTTTSDTGVWSSPTLATGEFFFHTFDSLDSFTYHCEIHPGMTGTITVVAAGEPPPPPPPPPVGVQIPTGTPIHIEGIPVFLEMVGGFLTIAGGILAAIVVMVSGLVYLLAGSNPQRVTLAKGMFKAGIIGSLIIFGVGIIINTVRVLAENPLRFFQ